MKVYAVAFECNNATFSGSLCIWFSCKAKAISYAKKLSNETSAYDHNPLHRFNNWTVHGVYKVDVPTGKNRLIEWLNDAECRRHSGDQIWSDMPDISNFRGGE